MGAPKWKIIKRKVNKYDLRTRKRYDAYLKNPSSKNRDKLVAVLKMWEKIYRVPVSTYNYSHYDNFESLANVVIDRMNSARAEWLLKFLNKKEGRE